jgi:hypothetical protein
MRLSEHTVGGRCHLEDAHVSLRHGYRWICVDFNVRSQPTIPLEMH